MAAKWETTDPELVTGDKSFMGELSEKQISALFRKNWEEDEYPDTDNPSAEAFSREIDLIGVRMGMLSHGSDFLIENGAPQKFVDEYEASKWEAIALAAAKQLKLSDHRPLLVKATRTTEQEKIMAEIAARESISRLQVFLGSIYNKATVELMAVLMGELRLRTMDDLTGRADWEDISSALAFLVRYFFALHGRLRAEGVEYIDPITPCPGALQDEHAEELRKIMKALISYRAKHGGGFYENIAPCFRLRVEEDHKALSITQLPSSEFFYEPTSKPNIFMHRIAAAGVEGQPVDVAKKKPGASPVIVDAAIHGENGETITIDGFEREIQAAIGNMIIKNNGITPIIVTPEQIYREYAQLDSAATVTEQQRAEVVRVMDKLMKAQARLDFSAQLQQHTHIEKQSDFDYEAEGAGRLSGAMIAARKTEAWWSGESVGLAYIIYDYPMYFLQAHAVNQMAQIRGELLRLMDKPEIKSATAPGTQNRARDVAIKRNLLMRISRMKKSKSVTRRIMISEIIEDNIAEPVSPKVERTIREKIETLLQGLKGQEDGIKDYTLVKRGRKITGFTIILPGK